MKKKELKLLNKSLVKKLNNKKMRIDNLRGSVKWLMEDIDNLKQKIRHIQNLY